MPAPKGNADFPGRWPATISFSEQLARLRRAQILDAATAVFAERGFHRATVRDVARAAGIADGTIYLYFPGKADLLVGILDRLNESTERESQLAAGTRDDFRAFFAAYLRQRFELLWPNAEVFRAVLPEPLANPDLRRLYSDRVIAPTLALAERHFAAEIARGRMRPLDVALTVRSLAALPLGLLVLHLPADAEVASRWSELPEAVAALLLDGLSRDEGNPLPGGKA